MPKKIIAWAIVIFVAFYLLTQPQAIHGLANLIKNAGNSLATFVNSL
jgi:hypothetical protein